MINDIMNKKLISKYRLSKLSNVPYTTISDICSNRADLRKCSVDTVYRIAKALGVTVEELLEPYYVARPDFDLFKSTVCHRLKDMGDIDFLIDVLESKTIFQYYDRKWYPESLYLLAMLDYLSKQNNLPVASEYDDLRRCKLSKPVFPASVIAESAASKNSKAKEEAMCNAIPEFMNYNIVEGDIRNVI